MSRVGNSPIQIPDGVDVTIDGAHVAVKGPKGELAADIPAEVSVEQTDGELRVHRPDDMPRTRSMHGLARALVANMVEGVTAGFRRELEIQGVGYRASMKGSSIEIQVGYSHPVVVEPPEGISFEVPEPTAIVVTGIDKQKVGQVAADIRKVRPPEPYKGKGIRYKDEYVRRKAGKSAVGAV